MSLINVKHIACVVDFNEESRKALSVAGTLALDSSAELCTIHVVERLSSFGNMMITGQPTYHTGYFDFVSDESYLIALRDMLNHSLPQNISLIPYIVYGSRIQTIIHILQKCQADLCVIGLRDKTDWWKHLFSSRQRSELSNLPHVPFWQ